MTANKIWIAIGFISMAILLFYSIDLGDNSSTLVVNRNKLTIKKIRKESFQEFIPVTGTIEPIKTVYLDISDGGKVIEKFVEEGAILKTGDPILKLYNPNLSLQVMNTQSSFLQAESVSRQTRLTFEQNLLNKQNQLLMVNLSLLELERIYKNNSVMFKKGLVAKNEYEVSREKFETMQKSKELLREVLKKDSLTFIQLLQQAETNTKMSKEYLNLVRNQLEKLTVRAPIDGQLTILHAEIGQSVGAGYRVGQINNIDYYKVRVEIDEHYISRIYKEQVGTYDYNGSNLKLKIATIYPHVANGKFFVDMIFVDKQPIGIRRGQTVRLKLELGNISEAIVVDRGPFYHTTGGQWIFILNENEKSATRSEVKIGRQNTKVYELLEGVKVGEKVITSSYENFSNIDKLILE